ncbi:pilus assembly protein [Microbulbifer sp. Q7]|uniref:pilus assembly protein n=1 Tax=Microbulbifer sp. Q7 TaxID=1785091 RepID=UPI00187C7F91|nr:PilC/PilY family type IV pilus protein [Microbulbifer sp. Q7]
MKTLLQCVSALFSVAAAHSVHSVDLAQSPLFLSNGATPNVMFVIDDSGSMHFEITPEDYRQDTAYIFPRADGVYGNAGYDQTTDGNYQVPTVDDANGYNALTRSPQYNKSYYNPSVTYLPWAKHDETLYPNANPSCARHNPENTGDCPGDGVSVNQNARNLTVENANYNGNAWRSCMRNADETITCTSSSDAKTYWPATYFWHNGTGSEWDRSSYQKVEIRPSAATYTGHDRLNRDDCSLGVCSYEQEIQNFANWYTYYRSRTLAARAGIGRAFAEQGEDLRVGFGAINQGSTSIDGVNTGTIVNGVRAFSGDDREAFFAQLYGRDVPTSGTPLRRALDDAGQYFSRPDDKGPWGANPGVDDEAAHLACRASYTILMTDGYWSGGGDNAARTSAARSNVDGSAGTEVTGPDGASYTYSAESPFTDGHNNTLADVAMYYWNRDLRPDLANKVPSKDGSINPAFWQHMVTFGVGFGVEGSVDKDDAFAAIKTGDSVTWPNPTSSNSAKVDDLLHASVNSRGGFFSAADPQSFASELSGVLDNILGRSSGAASSVATTSTRLGTDTLIFQAAFNSFDWSGELKAIEVEADGSIGDLAWEVTDNDFPSPASRDIFTYSNGDGALFAWDPTGTAPGISDAQKSVLAGEDGDAMGALRLNWVRGLHAEGLRERGKMLGDIVNSSPVYAGRKKHHYHLLSADLGGARYLDYYTTRKQPRTEVVYVGANDGMLHGFDARDGDELFAYVPSGVYGALKDLSSPEYGTATLPHRYSVDGPLFVGDAYFGDASTGSWKNILVGTLGAGGKGIFVLDVTNPESFDEDDVLFELTNADIPELGNITGPPLVVPTADGWKIIVGNGYNSAGERASLLVIDLENPTTETRVLTTNDSDDNGLAGASLLPNGRGEVVGAYAGDLQGNLWYFDLSSDDPADWGVGYEATTQDADGNDVTAKVPLFVARDPNGAVQPITSTPTLGLNEQMNNAVMVYFGTGSYLSSTDNVAGNTINSFYAIADQGAPVAGRGSLMQKVISSQENGVREVSNNASQTWWADKSGWYLDLTFGDSTTGERVISKPLLVYDRLLFPTLITSSDPCAFGGSGWQMELVAVGDRFIGHSIFGEDGKEVDYAIISYSQMIESGKKTFLPANDIKGDFKVEEGQSPPPANGRVSWRRF